MSLTRRELIQYGLSAASGAILLPLQFPNKALADVTSASATSGTTTPWQDFTTPLTFPDVLEPYKSDDEFDYYEIVMSKGCQPFANDPKEYEFWGYNGRFPGPTIKKKAYRQVKVDFVNQLGQTQIDWQGCFQKDMEEEDIRAAIHNHGMPSLPQYDGFAEDYILPDQFKTYIYPNNRAATYWYHDHQAGRTMRNVGMGLAGMWIVQDKTEFDLNLPQGKYDVPLIFQTPPFTWIQGQEIPTPPGQPKCPPPRSYTPPTLINGVHEPRLQVDTHKYRFRLLNATANQIYTLVLVSYDQSKNQSVDESIIVIGTDSGLRNSAVLTETLGFVMADRYEIIIDFSRRQIGSRMALVERFEGVDTPLICFEVSQQVKDESELPLLLRPYRPVDPDIASPNHSPDKEFTFYFDGTGPCDESGQAGTINHYLWDKDHIETSPGLNTWQKWRLTNPLDRPVHPIHIHLLDFQIVRRTNKGVEVDLPLYEDKSWKDVFNLGPNETIDIVGQFGPHVGKYMMHCHNLDHEDCDMMTNFEVVDPTGQEIPTDPLAVPAQDLPPDYPFKESTYQPYSTELTPPFA
ncbi:multicopper oxidase family protein [Microcoleus sp. T3B2]|uniref:multicopper oxidase family protein n=1 Tax=Microcoleus sp. T3B2 TaxID=3055426 RepID=UPI002FD01F10